MQSENNETNLQIKTNGDEYFFLEEGLAAGEVVSWVWYIPEDRMKSSENFAYLFSADPEELRGEGVPLKRVMKAIHEEDFDRVQKAIAHTIETGEHYSAEYRVHSKDGDTRWLAARGRVIYDDEGNPLKFPGVIIDITRRKQVEAELAKVTAKSDRQRRLYETILSSTPDLVYVFDLNYRFTYANKALLEMWGLSSEEAIGKNLREVGYEPWHAEMHEREIDQVIATKKPFRGEVSFPHDSLGDRIYDYIFAPVLNDKDEVEAIAGTSRDITELKEAKKELQHLNETLEERVKKRTASLLAYQKKLRLLASQLSKTEEKERNRLAEELHDNLGQMLAINKMKLDSIKENNLLREASAKVEKIKQGIDDAIGYTRNLMSSLKPPPSLHKEDIGITINWLAEKIKDQHGLHVIVEGTQQPRQVNEEVRTTLLQCVRELLFNVVKHTSVNTCHVTVSRMGNQMQVIVQDEGKGFDSRADIGPSEEKGFGLFNIRERIDLLGGSVKIDSEPGKGTKVTLFVPIIENDKADQQEEFENGNNVQLPSKGSNQKIKIIIADDHEMMRKGLKNIIEAEDDLAVVAEASNGSEAVELARNMSPNVILMDVNMPVMDGIEATHKIKSEMPDINVVGLSIHNHQDVKDSMRDVGASAYLNKSEAFEALCATIRSEAAAAKR